MTYSYICTSCGHEWEAQQRISEPPLQTCESCAQPSAKRQIAGPANFILKGGGWYSDLYSSSGKKAEGDKPGKAESTDKKAASADTTASTDKAEKKSEASPSTSPSTTTSSTTSTSA